MYCCIGSRTAQLLCAVAQDTGRCGLWGVTAHRLAGGGAQLNRGRWGGVRSADFGGLKMSSKSSTPSIADDRYRYILLRMGS